MYTSGSCQVKKKQSSSYKQIYISTLIPHALLYHNGYQSHPFCPSSIVSISITLIHETCHNLLKSFFNGSLGLHECLYYVINYLKQYNILMYIKPCFVS